MKKLLTLFTLLLCVCSGAWGKMVVMDFCNSSRSAAQKYSVNNMYSDGSGNGIYISAGGSTISVANKSSNTINDCSFSGYSSSNKNTYYFAMDPTSGESISKITFYFERQNSCTTATFVRKDGQAMTVDPIITLSDFDNSNPKQDSVVVVGEFVQGVAYTLTLGSNQKFYGARVEYGTTPTATFSNGNYTIGGSTLALSSLWESNAPGAVAYSVKDANGTGASISDGVFSATTAGTATVYAIQAAAGAYAGAIKTATITVVEGVIIPTLTGAWKIGDDEETSANVIQGGSVTIPTFTVGATSGTPTGSDYNVAYELKEGSTSGIFEFTDGVPTGISTATAGTATVTATLTTKDASKYLTPATNTFEYTVTVNAPAAPTFDPGASAVVFGTAITMTSPDGGEIWYTTDGNEPNESNKTIYAPENEPTITANTTIKALARVNGYSSAVVTCVYTVIIVEHQSKTWDFTNWSSETQAGVLADDTNWSKYEKIKEGVESSDLSGKTRTNKVAINGALEYDGITIPETQGLTFNAGTHTLGISYNQGSATVSSTEYTYNGNKYLWLYSSSATITIPNVPASSTITIATESHNGGDARYVSLSGVTGITQTQGATSGDAAKAYQVCKWTIPSSGNVVITPSKGLHIYYITIENDTPIEDVTVSAANYKSYNTTMPTDFSKTDGVQAFIVTEATPSAVTLTEVTTVPANTPVILKSSGDYELHGAAWAPAVIGNLLQISNGAVTGNGSTRYALANINDVPGFYLVSSGLTIPTSYVEIGGGAKNFIPFSDENTTEEPSNETDGIKAVSTKVENGVRYNLAGQKVGADYKGIVIVNGKKMLNK